MKLISRFLLGVLLVPSFAFGQAWEKSLSASLKEIDPTTEGVLGVFVKNLKTGREVSHRADESWYIASGTKLFVALACLRAIDAGTLTFESKVEVLETDYVDGAGELNYFKPGSRVSVRLLIDQMLTFSDNTASDMLIRTVGLERVNELAAILAPGAVTPITTLIEVRRHVYGAFHPLAATFTNMDYVRLKPMKEEARLLHVAKLANLKRADLKQPSIDAAYDMFYAEKLNHSTLRGYGLVLEKLAQGSVIKENSRRSLMNTLERIQTGDNRIMGGLSSAYTFAHKTGTQHRRFCDMGLMKTESSDEFVVVACVRQLSTDAAEDMLRKVGRALHKSGAFLKESK